MDRRLFLRRLSLGTAGLVLGEAALEQFARLTHVRKSFPSAGITKIVLDNPYGMTGIRYTTLHALHSSTYPQWAAGYDSDLVIFANDDVPPQLFVRSEYVAYHQSRA